MITFAGEKHIPNIVDIHCASLPDDFLPQLGRKFLENTFYPAVVASDQAALIVELDKESVTGFIIVTQDSGQFLSDIIKNNFWQFAWTGLRSSLRSFKYLRKNIEIVISSVFSKESHPAGEIYIIAVDQNNRGKGIGARLVDAAREYLKEHHIDAIKIKTLTSNVDWIGHFRKAGWKVVDQFRLIGNDYTVLQDKL